MYFVCVAIKDGLKKFFFLMILFLTHYSVVSLGEW